MNADEFTVIATITLQVLWIVFLLFAGYCAIAYSDFLRPRQGARAVAEVRAKGMPANKPRRHFDAGAGLE